MAEEDDEVIVVNQEPNCSVTIDNEFCFSSLPSELLDVIVGFSSAEDRLALCRVSKILRSLSVRHIYQELNLDSPESLIRCFYTLATYPWIAAMVKSLDVNLRTIATVYQHGDDTKYETAGQALQGLSQLENLRWAVSYDVKYIEIIEQCTFPLLDRLECQLELTHGFVGFLNRHPHLTHLQLNRQFPLLSVDFGSLPTVKLPNLRSFIGDAVYLPLVVQSFPSLRAAVPLFNGVDDDPHPALSALEECSGDTLNVLSCRRRGWNLDLLEAVSLRLPNIFFLDLTNVLILDSFPGEEAIETIRVLLTRFTRLEKFSFGCVNIFHPNDLENHLDEDFETVVSWGAACPSLYEITLPHSPRWIRVSDDFWLADPSDERGAEWFSKRMEQYTEFQAQVKAFHQQARDLELQDPELFGQRSRAIMERLNILMDWNESGLSKVKDIEWEIHSPELSSSDESDSDHESTSSADSTVVST